MKGDVRGGGGGGNFFYRLTVTGISGIASYRYCVLTVCYVTVIAVTDRVDKQQKIESLQILQFLCLCRTKQNTSSYTKNPSNMKWKENEELVLRNGAEFFLEMKESSRNAAHANKETARPAVPRTRAWCRVTATGAHCPLVRVHSRRTE